MNKKFKTDQEEFWTGRFGEEYILRNQSDQLLASNLHFFAKIFDQLPAPRSIIEFGANIGMNLKAMKLLFPGIQLYGIEINEKAAKILGETIGDDHVFNESILDVKIEQPCEVALIKGVLIHINPGYLPVVYEKLFNAATKFIIIAEYYNPTPVSISYRGHEDKLFKRDFAGEMMEKYPELELIKYGFSYRRDPAFPQDDISWFVLKKK